MKYIILIIAGALLCGCGSIPKPQRGGHATFTKTAGTEKKAAVTKAEMVSPDNPQTPSTQNYERTTKTTVTLPAGSRVLETTVATDKDGTGAATNRTETVLAAPSVRTVEETEKTTASTGTAQKDTARDLGARLSAMRPVQWVGIVLILGALALCYFQWWTKAAIVGGVGIGMIVVAQVIPGNELLILGVGGAVAIIGTLLVLYVYYKGRHDNHVETPPAAPIQVAVQTPAPEK